MRVQGVETRPLFDYRHYIWTDCNLSGQTGGKVNGTAVLDAAILRPDLGYQLGKLKEELVTFVWTEFNSRNNVNHRLLLI